MKKAIKVKDTYPIKEGISAFRLQSIYKLDPPYKPKNQPEEEFNYVFVSGVYSDYAQFMSRINTKNNIGGYYSTNLGMFSSLFLLHEVMIFGFHYDENNVEIMGQSITEIKGTTSHILALDSIGYRIVDE